MPREISYVPATDALLELVRTGLGISVFAKWAVARQLRAGELVGIPLTKTGRRRQWYAAVRRAIANRSAIGALVSLLREHAPAFQTRSRAVAAPTRPCHGLLNRPRSSSSPHGDGDMRMRGATVSCTHLIRCDRDHCR